MQTLLSFMFNWLQSLSAHTLLLLIIFKQDGFRLYPHPKLSRTCICSLPLFPDQKLIKVKINFIISDRESQGAKVHKAVIKQI